MDKLIREYAEILRNAKVGDFTYEGILAEFANRVLIHEGLTNYEFAKAASNQIHHP
jgi:hypothetical protein